MTVAHHYLMTVSNVDTIVIPIVAVADIKAFYVQPTALHEHQSPASATLIVVSPKLYLLTFHEVEQVGTHDFAGSMQAGEVVRIFLDTLQMKAVDGKRHLAPLSVDDATARYLDVSALISHYESEAIDVFRHRFALH